MENKQFKEGEVIYFEYEHHYNHRSSAMRYKKGYFLELKSMDKTKALVILQSLHGSWNQKVSVVDVNRLYKQEEMKP